MSSWMVVGIGNRYRSDDGVGPFVADLLRADATTKLDVRILNGEASDLVALWEGRDSVVVVDAVRSGAAPGTVWELDGREPIPRELAPCSTHVLNLAQALELARALGRLPARIRVFGIEAGDLSHGEGLTPEVERSARGLARRLARELSPEVHHA